MTTILTKAPLIELIADLQWDIPHLPGHADGTGAPIMIPQSIVDPSHAENLFTRFIGSIYQYGFRSAERLMPQGIVAPGQMVYRFRQGDTDAPPVRMQIGANQFSANALPPYKIWDEFRPWIESGVRALLEAQADNPVSLRASVRYIDAFGPDLTDGLSSTEFFDQKLGLSVGMPDALSKRLGDRKPKSLIKMVLPLEGRTMVVRTGDGFANGRQAAILDTQVSVTQPVEPDLDTIMGAFDSAQQVIHHTFFELVVSIMDKLKPIEHDGSVH